VINLNKNVYFSLVYGIDKLSLHSITVKLGIVTLSSMFGRFYIGFELVRNRKSYS